MLTLNLTNADSFLPQDYLTSRKPRLEQAAEMSKMADAVIEAKQGEAEEAAYEEAAETDAE